MKQKQPEKLLSRRARKSSYSGVMAVSLFSIGLFAIFTFYFMVMHHHTGETEASESSQLSKSPVSTSAFDSGAIAMKDKINTLNTITVQDQTSQLPALAKSGTNSTQSFVDSRPVGQNPLGLSMQIPAAIESGSNIASSNEPLAVKKTNALHAVTYASHGGRDDRFCRAVESAIRHDVNLIILGWGVKWIGLSQKLEAAHNFAAALPPTDIILFTDAFDVMFTNKADHILEEFENENSDIIFAGECGCWPHVIIDKGKACFSGYPQAPTPYRYLNSGTWIGKAHTAEQMLAAVIEEAGKDFANANDQKLVADMFMQGRFGIKLDYNARLFQSMHMTYDKPLPHCDPKEDIEVIADGRFHNKRTDSLPSVFHFNGGGKRHHLAMESQLWYKKKASYNTREALRVIADTELAVPLPNNKDRKMKFRDICGSYFKGKV